MSEYERTFKNGYPTSGDKDFVQVLVDYRAAAITLRDARNKLRRLAAAAQRSPEEQVAVKFLRAWLTSPTGIVAPYEDGQRALNEIADFCECNASGCAGEGRLRTMAAVLSDTAKAEAANE